MDKNTELFNNYMTALEASKAHNTDNSIESLEISSLLLQAVRNAEQALKAHYAPKVGA